MRTLAILLLTAAPAMAGSFDPATEDATVIAPECTWFGFIPCHTGFDYEEPEGEEPEGDEPRTIADWWQEPPRQPEPEPEQEPEVCK